MKLYKTLAVAIGLSLSLTSGLFADDANTLAIENNVNNLPNSLILLLNNHYNDSPQDFQTTMAAATLQAYQTIELNQERQTEILLALCQATKGCVAPADAVAPPTATDSTASSTASATKPQSSDSTLASVKSAISSITSNFP